jgi:uncharacterized protein YndB with AHSA1/START domain
MRGPDGAEITLRGTYREVDPPERLVSTESFSQGFSEAGWRPADETVSTMLLTEQDGRTTWTLTTTYPTREVRDAAYALKQAWDGMGYSLDRLDDVLRTRDLVVSRTFDAPIARVWQAWTESDDVKRWWGPLGVLRSHRKYGRPCWWYVAGVHALARRCRVLQHLDLSACRAAAWSAA